MPKKDIKHIEANTEIVDGKMLVVASDETTDRVGDSLKVKDWNLKDFKKNPVLQAGHDYRPQFTIGVAKNIRVEGKKLLFEPEFHNITALAREIKEMFDQGFLKAWSVGFVPADYSKSGDNVLLEVSAVAVPANPNALVLAKGLKDAKEMADEQAKEIKSKLKDWMIEDADKTKEVKKEVEIDVSEEELEDKPEEVTEEAEEVTEDKEEVEFEEDKEEEEVTEEVGVPVEEVIEEIEKIEEVVEEKVGKVLSKKNLKIIGDAKAKLNDIVIVLDKLTGLEDGAEKSVEAEVKQETPQKSKGMAEIIKVEKPKVAQNISQDDIIVRALQKIAKNSNFALNKIKNK